MFHDKTLPLQLLVNAAFDLNAHACKLALLVQWYKDRGEKTLPVSYVKRLGFTRRQWELATKGSRKRDGNKIAKGHEGPAKDGLEATGMITEMRQHCERTKTVKTFWVIGDVTPEVLDAIRKEREDEQFEVIEDHNPGKPEKGERVEPSTKEDTQLATEKAYNEGYADGHADGYDRGTRNLETVLGAGCCKATPIDKSSRDVAKRHAGTPAFLSQSRPKMLLPGRKPLCALVADWQRHQSEQAFDNI